MALHELEGYDEVVQRFIELIPPETLLRLIPPEKRLAGLPPEQRLAGLAPEQAVLALPDEVLRALSNDFIEKLPEPVQATIRRRLGR